MNKWMKQFPAALFLGAAAYVLLRSHVYRPPSIVDLSTVDLYSLDGSSIPLSEFRNKPIVLNFWASWCAPCRHEMPWLADLQRRNPDVAVIGLDYDEDDLEQARKLIRRSPVNYRLVSPGKSLFRTFGSVPTLPTTLYISASGKVVHTIAGVVPETIMQGYLHDAETSR